MNLHLRFYLLLALSLLLIATAPGCAVLSDHRVAAGCQVADGLTTYYALTHGATEANSLIAGMSPAAILLLKVAFAAAIYFAYKEKKERGEEKSGMDKFALGAITVLGCVPAANNLAVIQGLP